MVKSHRIGLVVDLAKKKEEEAASELAQVQALIEGERQRLNELLSYYNTYEQSQMQIGTGLNAQHIEKTRHFLQQLSVAKEAQQYQIQVVTAQYEEKNTFWRKCYLQRIALENLVKRYERDERLVLDKQEQKMLDEWFTSKQQAR